ncbi:glycosyltransferase [Plantactinospora sp. WMMB782]|uniref:glycosyltransferase n=1 Tax=Plantactinospora sp. WMMB782 TaxID=3404121 RepID=UPI003B933676
MTSAGDGFDSGDDIRALCRRFPGRLAAAVADTLVVTADPRARSASPTYWDQARRWRDEVTTEALALAADSVRTLAGQLVEAPDSTRTYFRLRTALARLAARPDAGTEALFRAAWRAEGMSRIGYHVGRRYLNTGDEMAVQALLPASLGGPPAASVQPDGTIPPDGTPRPVHPDAARSPNPPTVLVVVPFRDGRADAVRLRNALACLRALADQALPRHRYHVTVVESDSRPRWREAVHPLADTYLFAPKDGPFNKAWTVNVGVRNSPVRTDLVCVLDADILVDRHFLLRNGARFLHAGVGALLPYRNALYLDPAASRRAIARRCLEAAPSAERESLRGFALRSPSGGCVWLRTELFHRVGGLDERFEGWGGEDDDFAIRLGLWAALERYSDTLLHLYHPPARAEIRDGVPTNGPAGVQYWPTREIGVIDRYAPGADAAGPDAPNTQEHG